MNNNPDRRPLRI